MLVRKDQKRLNAAGRRTESKKGSKASPDNMASDATKRNFLDITALVRSIQRDEGHTDCFRKGVSDCDKIACKWRSFCLEGRQILSKG